MHTRYGERVVCHENALGVLCSLLVPQWSKVRSGNALAPVCSLGQALQQLLSLPGVTEELKLPGEQLHLHRHRLVLLTVDAEGAPAAL